MSHQKQMLDMNTDTSTTKDQTQIKHLDQQQTLDRSFRCLDVYKGLETTYGRHSVSRQT